MCSRYCAEYVRRMSEERQLGRGEVVWRSQARKCRRPIAGMAAERDSRRPQSTPVLFELVCRLQALCYGVQPTRNSVQLACFDKAMRTATAGLVVQSDLAARWARLFYLIRRKGAKRYSLDVRVPDCRLTSATRIYVGIRDHHRVKTIAGSILALLVLTDISGESNGAILANACPDTQLDLSATYCWP